jgi:hypothetical protein
MCCKITHTHPLFFVFLALLFRFFNNDILWIMPELTLSKFSIYVGQAKNYAEKNQGYLPPLAFTEDSRLKHS